MENKFYISQKGSTSLVEVKPHYKNLSKHFAKESNQAFFRESIEGRITLWGQDYLHIKNASLEDTLEFHVYRDGKQYAVNEFNKTDCKFDHAKGSVELKLSPKDKYTNVLNEYGKTYDLLKMSIRKSTAQLTKRCAIQMYLKGGNTISNYASGTYWEDEVLNPVYNDTELMEKYHFSRVTKFLDIEFAGFTNSINGLYLYDSSKSIWNNKSGDGSIVFEKVYSAGENATITDLLKSCYKMSDGVSSAQDMGFLEVTYLYDTYEINVYSERNGEGTKLYSSKAYYGKDTDLFELSVGEGLYAMRALSILGIVGKPEEFNIGEHFIEYDIWARLLCNSNKNTYDLPTDDFATERVNYTKCADIGDSGIQAIQFKQSIEVQDSPTPYGVDAKGKYFISPTMNGVNGALFPYPFIRSTWANTSLWVAFEDNNSATGISTESLLSQYYKTINHKDCMEIGAVIKAMLSKMDSSIKFDATSEYSQFLYGSQFSGSIGAKGLKVLITQKSNVLKGEYDQAAKKAETTLEQIMNMLNKCFRCYWYIDENNRLRIEHISYFLNGKSYSAATLQYDLTAKYDKFNKKSVQYGQNEVTFNKSDLSSRYEFAWSDDATEALGGGFFVDVVSNYVQKDKVESINIESFTPDIDLMMFSPSRFAQDGFALIITDSNYKVPIVYKEIYNRKNDSVAVKLNVQNYYASFISLFNYYLYDMPAMTIISSVDKESVETKEYNVSGIKRCMRSDIQYHPSIAPDVYKLIGTENGKGTIEDMTIDIDTGMVKATLSYEPS